MPDDPALRIFPDEYVPNAEGVPYHGKWVRANPLDAARWAAFRDAVIATGHGAVPVMATKYGKALVAAGKEHLAMSQILGAMIPPTPPPPIPPFPPPTGRPSQPPAWTGPVTITQGGTYEVAAEATVAGASAVTITTAQPVTLTGWVRNLAGGAGTLINSLVAGQTLIVENLWAYGKLIVPNNVDPIRFLWTQDAQTLIVRNCTLENTAGIEVNGGQASGSVLITRNRCINIQGYVNNPLAILRVGNFAQLRTVTSPTQEISWNEIIDEHDKSWPEDIISAHAGHNSYIHDNMLWGQTTPGNPFNDSSQGGITIDGSAVAINNHRVESNQIVGGFGISCYNINGGTGNLLLNNRVIRSPNIFGTAIVHGNGFGWTCAIPFAAGGTNHAHGNVVGYHQAGGAKAGTSEALTALVGAAEGASVEVTNNTTVPGTITAADEQAEWTLWQQKLLSNGITIGP